MKKPVLILGMVPRITTPIARSLSRIGVEVDVATFSAIERPVGSRAIRNFWRVPDPGVSASAFQDRLRDLIRRHGHDMLIPANDVALSAVVEHYGWLNELLHVGCPPPEITFRVLDKTQTLEAARQCGVRVPRSFVASHSGELTLIGQSLGFPFILKPSEKQPTDEFKTCVIRDAGSLRQRFPIPRQFVPPMLVQEFCRGEGVGVEVLMHDGEPLLVFQHRRIKELPPGGGVAVIAVADAPNPNLVRSSVLLLRQLQWDGVAMVEFKLDESTGAATLMEVNGRYWGTVSLPLLAGMDFPLHHWKLVHGQRLDPPLAYEIGTKWRWTAGLINRWHDLLLEARRGPWERRLLWHECQHFLHDFGPSVRDALFSPEDPMPAILEALRVAKDLALSDLRRILKIARPTHQVHHHVPVVKTRATALQEVGDAKIDSRN